MLETISRQNAALIIFAVAVATIGGAWAFEYIGYAPCELCLLQRWAYYVAIPLALGLVVISPTRPELVRYGLVLLGILWLCSMLFGTYHAGVEWKWWAGPSTCTGTGNLSAGLPDLSKPVVMCDEPALRILGLSLAGWNALISFGLAIVAFAGARRHGSSSVSQ